MNSTSIKDKQPELIVDTCEDPLISQNFIEGIQAINAESNFSKSTDLNEPKKSSDETKKESIIETDDSFDIFVPLKVKTYKNGLKKPNNLSSTNKYKKKKVISSNRICPYFSTRKSPTSSKEDRDLKLAIARSLEDISPSKSSENVLSDIANGNKTNVIEKKLVKQTSNFLKSLTNKTKKPATNTLLFRRTGEERQEIIIKKIGILLIEKENIHDQCYEQLEINLLSSNLEELWDKNSTLWELSKIDVNNIAQFYVSKLEKFICQPIVAGEQPITAMSVVNSKENDNIRIPEKVMNIKIEDDLNLPEENHEDKPDGIKQEHDSDCNSDFPVDYSFSIKDKFLTDSLKKLSNDLFSVFGSKELSDFNILLKSSETLPCHRFILQARCPNLLSDVLWANDSNSLDFSQYSTQATKAFFKFIYSGKTDLIYCLGSEDKSDLYVLAKKYKLEFLEDFLLKSFTANSFHVYSQSTCSPPESPIGPFPDSSQGPVEQIEKKHSEFSSLAQESFEKDKEKLTLSKENQGKTLSFANLTGAINNVTSNLHINSPHNYSKEIFSSIADESLYDIFKDEIKSPCNSSLLSQSFHSKRKLDYNDALKETKKVCSESVPMKKENSPEIVILDSDSNDECPFISKSNLHNISGDKNNSLKNQSVNEEIFIASQNSSDLNIKDYFSKSEVDFPTEPPVAMSPFKISPYYDTSCTPSKSSLESIKQSSLNKDRSVDKYFEASFPEVNENIEVLEKFSQQMPMNTPPVNKHLPKRVLTPLQEIIVGKATPKPDYNTMISPDLKAELKKYGIKPNLDPNKARSLLQYIYEQIHPVRTELPKCDIEPSPSTSKDRSPSPVILVIDDDSSHSDKWNNSESDFAYEEYLYDRSKSKNELSTNEIDTCESDLKTTIINFIKSNNELFRNIVLFRPLLFKKFYKTVKEHGIKCTIYELMDVLDDLCVNYHVEKKDNNRQKRRGKKQTVKRKPLKKS